MSTHIPSPNPSLRDTLSNVDICLMALVHTYSMIMLYAGAKKFSLPHDLHSKSRRTYRVIYIPTFAEDFFRAHFESLHIDDSVDVACFVVRFVRLKPYADPREGCEV